MCEGAEGFREEMRTGLIDVDEGSSIEGRVRENVCWFISASSEWLPPRVKHTALTPMLSSTLSINGSTAEGE